MAKDSRKSRLASAHLKMKVQLPHHLACFLRSSLQELQDSSLSDDEGAFHKALQSKKLKKNPG